MNISFKIRNLEKVKKYLDSLPRGVTFVALEAISKWLVGDSQSGLRHSELQCLSFQHLTPKKTTVFVYQ